MRRNLNKGIIVVSFGTTYSKTRELCIESIENRIKDEFKEALVLRAFTSRIVIFRLKKRGDYHMDTEIEALSRMKEEGIRDIYIQPLHIIQGHEYEKILRKAHKFSEDNENINLTIGKPLLSTNRDYHRVVEGLNLSDKEKTTLFMGHGSSHDADMSYEKLQDVFNDKGYKNAFVGTVEGEKSIEDILDELKKSHINKVDLRPFMLVAGDHAINDMASDEPDSWKSILEENGIEVEIAITGLGEIKAIQDIFIDHLRDIY